MPWPRVNQWAPALIDFVVEREPIPVAMAWRGAKRFA